MPDDKNKDILSFNVQKQQIHEIGPFIGPRSFQRNIEEQKLFFGRTYETERIISLIYAHKLILIYAQSGAGKTSIFNAGVIPELEKRGLDVLPVARVGIGSNFVLDNSSKPTIKNSDIDTEFNNSSIELANKINPYMHNAFQSMLAKKQYDSHLNYFFLSEFLSNTFPHRTEQRRGRPMPQVLVFDQLEELFNLYVDPNKWHEQQEEFFRQINDALEKDCLLRIVLIIREDYLAQLDPFAEILPENLKSRFRVERLRKDAAFEAIKGPLERSKTLIEPKALDRLFEEHIIDRLVEDLLKIRVETFGGQFREVKGEFVEPIQLQLVCQRLWKKLKTSQFDQIAQDDFGYLGDVRKALEDFYLESIGKASKQTGTSEGSIRNWFEEKLITSSGTRGVVHRGVRTSGGIPNSVTDILENKYLIRKEERIGSQWYELTHDRLIQPIIDSNAKWKNERKKKNLILKIVIPSSIVIAVLTCMVIFNLFNFSNAEPRTSIGVEPSHIDVNPRTNMEYVANSGSNTVSVIDGKTNKVIANITVGHWPYPISVNPLTNMVYVANLFDNTVSVIDGKTNIVIASIKVGNRCSALSVNPTTNRIYGINEEDGTVSVIDGKTNSVINTIKLGKGTFSDWVSVNPTTNRVYVANPNGNTVSVIDGKTNKVIASIPVDKDPFMVSVNPLTDILYVVDKASNAVSVIDGKTNKVIASIPVGANPDAIFLNPSTNTVYVANEDSNTVSVIDGHINTVITNIPVDAAPNSISVNPTTNRVYVVNYNGNTVSVIDGNTNKVIDTIYGDKLHPKGIRVGDAPNSISLNPSTNLAYTSDTRSNTVSVIDGKTNKVIASIPVGKGPYGVSVNLSTNRIYTVNQDDSTVSVIDGKTNSVIHTITGGKSTRAVSVNLSTNRIYTVNQDDNTVSVIDGKTNTVTNNITVGNVPRDVSINPSTNLAYVANYLDNTVSVIDGKTNKVIASIPVGKGPYSIDVNPSTNLAYVANYLDNTVSVIDGKTNKVIANIQTNNGPHGVSVNLSNNRIYVVNLIDNTVSVIDGKTNKVKDIIPVGRLPWDICVNPLTNKVYVVNNGDNTVSVIDANTNSVIS